MKDFEESKIASLAKELSNDLTAEDLGIADMSKVSSIQDAFSVFGKNPDKMLNVVKKVGTIVQQKLQANDLNQEDLLQDAQQLLSRMGSNPMFQDMMRKVTR